MAIECCGPSVSLEQTILTATVDNSKAPTPVNLLTGHVSAALCVPLSSCECTRRSAYADTTSYHGQPTREVLKQGLETWACNC